MKRTLRYLLFTAVYFLSLGMSAQQTTTINYCPNDPTSDEMVGAVLNNSSAVSIQAAVVIPAERTASLRGAKITKIRFYADEGMIGTYAWVKGGLSTPALGSPVRVGKTVEGWNEAELAKPVEITDRDLVVGFEGSLPAGKHIYVAGGQEHYSNLNRAKEGWHELSEYGLGSLCIQAVVEAEEGMVLNDLTLQSVTLSKDYFMMGEEATATLVIGNYGSKTVPVPSVKYTVNGNPFLIPIQDTFAPNTFKTVDLIIPASEYKEGVNQLKVSIDVEDCYVENNSAEVSLPCASKMFPRKALIEQFTTLQCGYCPNGLRTLNALTEGRDDYAWVAHHVGFGRDELTQVICEDLLYPFGINGAPTACFSRIHNDLCDSPTKPSFGLGYANASGAAAMLRPYLDNIVKPGSCVKIGIANNFDEGTSTLTTKVTAIRNAIFSYLYPGAQLSVWIVEDGCLTQAAQSGSGDKIHDHVFRATLTPTIFGESIDWNDDEYTETFTYNVPANSDPANMQVVAFIAMPNTPDATKYDVANVNVLPFDQAETAGIQGVINGDSEVLKREYFDLQGRPLQSPNGGLYIERVYTKGGVKTYKRI